ncbi:MAG: DVUA0089 family protein [Planctomycetota bacterium]
MHPRTRPSTWLYAALPAALAGFLYSCSSGSSGGGPPALLAEAEPNDLFDDAAVEGLTPGRGGAGQLDDETDIDFWSMALTEGEVVQLELFGTRLDHADWDAGDSLPRITVYDVDGTTVLVNHDYTNQWSWGKHDLDHPRLLVPATGTYYASVTVDGLAVTDGDYVIRLNRVNAGALQLETAVPGVGNDTIATAEPIVPGTLYGFHVDDESDYFSFVIASPSIVRFELISYRNGIIEGDDEYLDPYLYLYDTDLNGNAELFSDDDSFFYDSAIHYFIDTPGTYYIEVTECCGAGDAPYFLTYARSNAGGASESEPNDDTAGADVISYGGSITGSIDALEEDWFRFQGTAGDMVRIQAFDSDNGLNLSDSISGTVYGPDGITALPVGGLGSLETATTILQETGLHYIVIEPEGGLTDYRLELTRFRSATYESEPNNLFGDANALGAGGRSAGVIEGVVFGGPVDTDTFSFTAAANRLTTISIYASSSPTDSDGFFEFSGHGSSLQPTLRILDSVGDPIATSPADWSNVSTESVTNGLPCGAVSFIDPDGGTFYVEVTDALNGSGAAYYYVIERTN